MWVSTSHWTFLKWCWVLGRSYYGYVLFVKLYKSVIPYMSFHTCHLEHVILNLLLWICHSKPVIQNLSFRTNNSKSVIPNLSFQSSYSKPVISNLSFRIFYSEPVKWKLSFQPLTEISFFNPSYFKKPGVFHKSGPALSLFIRLSCFWRPSKLAIRQLYFASPIKEELNYK